MYMYRCSSTQPAMATVKYIVVIMVAVMMVSMDTQAGEVTPRCGGPKNQRASAACSPYTRTGQDQQPSEECCVAYKELVESANTTAERINLCYCIKRSARSRPADISKVDSIFGICGIPFIYSADPKFDCDA